MPHPKPIEVSSAKSSNAPGDPPLRTRIHKLLLDWYAAEGRDLPWRHTRDPYAVLVSEVMLQQTQVDRVLPKYHEFLGRFPTLAALAAAPTAEVIRTWAPLGYNVRAVRLQQIARQAVADYDGSLPGTLDGLLALKGIGRYTAGAVACFAFGLPVATVDTNIRRALWRVLRGIEPAEWPAGQAAVRDTLALAEWALPPGQAYDWQQALMDLGATVCVSRRPACERCPLAAECAAFAEVGAVTLFPSGEALTRLRDERAAAAADLAGQADGNRLVASRRVAERRAGYAADGSAPGKMAAPPHPRRRGQSAAPFTSTSRYFRGRVLAALRPLDSGAALALEELGPLVKPDWTPADLPWLRGIVQGLERDGLARTETIDAGESDASAIRVRLP
jgi:A/G-specific adenine glycosylase